MTLRDVLEYRAADSDVISLSLDDMPRECRAIYARPFGVSQWGYYAGEFYFDAAYRASHTGGSS